jgi:hypothetical protein
MTAYLYWRCNFTASNGSNIGVAEIAMHTSIGGSDVCTGGTASGTNINSSYPATNAFDQNLATDCQLTSSSGTIAYGFASSEAIVEYTVTSSATLANTYAPENWTFEGSPDGVNWTIMAYVRGQVAWGANETRTFPVNAGAESGHEIGLGNMAAVSPSMSFAGGSKEIFNPKLFGNRVFSPAGTDTHVSGVVSVLGTPTVGLLVRAYRTTDGVMMGQAYTNNSGAFSIECGGAASVYVVAFDPTTYQAIVYDQITPA